MERFRPGVVGWLTLLIVVNAAACGGSQTRTGEPRAENNVRTATSAIPSPLPIPASTLATLLPQATDYQRAVLADGMLTLTEYEAAKLAQVQCLNEAGLNVLGGKLNGLYLYRFTVAAPADSAGPPPAIGFCKKEYANVIEMVWAEVSVPMSRATIDESRQLMAECYKASSLKVDAHPEDSPDPEIQQRYRECLRKVQTALDIEGFSFGVDGDGRRSK